MGRFLALSTFLIGLCFIAQASAVTTRSLGTCAAPLQLTGDTFWGESVWDEGHFFTQYVLDHDRYVGTKEVALKVSKLCSSNCTVVGIGGSPTPVTAFLQGLQEDSAINFPISDFRFHPDANAALPFPYNNPKLAGKFRPLTEVEETRLFEHFANYLLPKLKQPLKKIALLDISEAGASLFSTERHLRKFLEKSGLNIEVTSIGVTSEKHAKLFRDMAAVYGVQPQAIVLPDDCGFIKDFDLALYKTHNRTEYEKQILGVPPTPVGSHHRIFKNTVKVQMFLDPDLDHSKMTLPILPDGVVWDTRKRVFRRSADNQIVVLKTHSF